MKFDVDSFSFLQENEYPKGYSTVTKDELENTINNLIANEITEEDAPEIFKSVETYLYFLGQIKSGGLGELSNDALVVKCDEEGIIEQVYGPAIFKGEDGKPVMRVCNDFYQLTFSGSEITCGIATGEVGVEERDSKDENGNDIKTLVINFDGYFDVVDESFEVPFILETSTGHQKNKVKSWFKKGDLGKVSDLLKEPPSGGNWTSLNDLALGEYQVYDIQENEPHEEWGRSWLIFLEGVGPVMSKGNRLKGLLTRNAKIYAKKLKANKPLTFNVSSKEEVGGGIRVNCGFFSRLPKPEKLVAAAQPKQITAEEPTKQLAAATQTQTVETKAVAMDQIAF
ncbi:hypothetical protein Lepto7375DRAFT_7433 [Leptolyngbya sp. PCC 7375]|nr:hypothetical protein Lepto7375DRAFT_7433 [Leptolyngbya sp. PCC 7375]